MKSLEQLQESVIEWANERKLLFPENAPKQKLKLIEECGELARAILKNDIKEQKDAIGDVFVVLTILAEQLDIPVTFDFTNIKENSIDWFKAVFPLSKTLCNVDCINAASKISQSELVVGDGLFTNALTLAPVVTGISPKNPLPVTSKSL